MNAPVRIVPADTFLEPSAYSDRAYLGALRLEARASELHWREAASLAQARETLIGAEMARGYSAAAINYRCIASACTGLIDILSGHDLDMAECIGELDLCLAEECAGLLGRVDYTRKARRQTAYEAEIAELRAGERAL